MASFVLTGTSTPNPSPTDPTNSSSVPHCQENVRVHRTAQAQRTKCRFARAERTAQ